MGAPPQKSGPGAGVIIGIGCAALVVLGGVAIGLGVYFTRKAAATIAGSLPSATTLPGGPASPGMTTSGDLKAEVRDLRHFKGDFGKTRHFIGEIYNTGTEPMGFPTAKVTLFDAANVAVDSGTCASLVRVLPPGEKVPCALSVFKVDTFNTFKVEITPMKSFYRGDLANLEVTDIKFTPKRGYNPHQLEGKITNKGTFKAKSVWAIVSLYGTDGKIVGSDQTLIAGNDLDPGGGAIFTAKIYNVADKPETYRVKAIGYSD
jgi:hypothetical protein